MRRILGLLGVLAATLIPVAPASAAPGITVDSFSSLGGTSLVARVTYTGASSLTSFGLGLTGTVTTSDIAVIAAGDVSESDCTSAPSGVDCSFPADLIPNGSGFILVFTTDTAYPAGSSNSWTAGDESGPATSTFLGPAVPTCPTLALAPSTLAVATQDVAYQHAVIASGGTGPYTYLVNSGGLPDGVTLGLNGSLAGTPSAIGYYAFQVLAFDANDCAVTHSYILQVHIPVTTKPCRCAALTLKVDPALINVKKLRQHARSLALRFNWTMICTTGTGHCSAKASFTSAMPHGLKLNHHTRKFSCTGTCPKSTRGHWTVKLTSKRQLKQLYGRTLSFTVRIQCLSLTTQQVVKVAVDKHGILRLART